MMLRLSWGGVGWDFNVHVTLMMLRSDKVAGFETIGPPEDIPTCAVLSFISTPTF